MISENINKFNLFLEKLWTKIYNKKNKNKLQCENFFINKN